MTDVKPKLAGSALESLVQTVIGLKVQLVGNIHKSLAQMEARPQMFGGLEAVELQALAMLSVLVSAVAPEKPPRYVMNEWHKHLTSRGYKIGSGLLWSWLKQQGSSDEYHAGVMAKELSGFRQAFTATALGLEVPALPTREEQWARLHVGAIEAFLERSGWTLIADRVDDLQQFKPGEFVQYHHRTWQFGVRGSPAIALRNVVQQTEGAVGASELALRQAEDAIAKIGRYNGPAALAEFLTEALQVPSPAPIPRPLLPVMQERDISHERCRSTRDGDCYWGHCPQQQPGVPPQRSCPLLKNNEDDEH